MENITKLYVIITVSQMLSNFQKRIACYVDYSEELQDYIIKRWLGRLERTLDTSVSITFYYILHYPYTWDLISAKVNLFCF